MQGLRLVLNSDSSAERSSKLTSVSDGQLLSNWREYCGHSSGSGNLFCNIDRYCEAQRAGLREGDVMIGLEQEAIANIDDLHKRLTEDRVGVRSRLTIIRGAEKTTLEIVPSESKPVAR